MKNKYSNYFYTPESTRIFFSCNFHPDQTQVVERPIVFIYGLVCSNHQWSFQIPYFDQLGFPVITHDFRAHFASSGREDLDSVTFKNITSDLHHLLHHLKAKNCILISHSMGVNVALEFTRRFPDMVSQIVLISGTVLGPKQIMFNSNISDMTFPTLQWLSQKIPHTFGFLWKYSYMNPLIRKMVHEGGFNTKTVTNEFITSYMKFLGELPYELFYKLIEEMTNHDIINSLEEINVPALIIGGDKDSIIPNKHQMMIKEYLKNSELYIVHNGSHVPQADFPELINERITRFLSKHKPMLKRLEISTPTTS